MKTRSTLHLSRVLLLTLTVSVAAISGRALAAERKSAASEPAQNAPTPEWAELFGGAPLAVVWQSADAALAKIAAAVSAQNHAGVAAWAETIHLAVHALEDQAKLGDVERQKRLNGALRQAAKIADDVMVAAEHAQSDVLADSLRRLQSAWKLAALRMPAEITGAAPQELRFAKPAPARSSDGHAAPPPKKK